MKRRLAFLSGAPRTSTKRIASLTGGRQHILGTIAGFEANGWIVDRYVVGDKVPESWLKAQHDMDKGKSFVARLGADLVRMFLSLTHLPRILKEIPTADWVYERYAAYQFFGYLYQRRGIPWILETNDALFKQVQSELKHVALPGIVRWAERRAYRQCDILVVISEELRRILVQELNIPAAKIVVLPNAADIETFDPTRVTPRRLFDQDTFVIGFQGAMYKRHGLEHLVRAVARMRAEGMNVAAVFLGDGGERSGLESLSHELGIADFTKFPGRVAREIVPEYIAGYDLCYSGQMEWMGKSMHDSPLKLYDYMSMAKPVVASRFPDAVRLTRNGEIGFLYEPGNLDALVSAATLAYNNRDTLGELGAAARIEIVANHTWETRVREFIATAEALLSKEPGRPVERIDAPNQQKAAEYTQAR
jgi:glycosyltransferase involved in cell wall biosynthesis